MSPGPVDVSMMLLLFLSMQRSGAAAILVTMPGSRLVTATSPSRLTEVRDGLPWPMDGCV